MLLDRIGLYRARRSLSVCHLHGPALILASGPDPVLPSAFDEGWKLLCVNASGRSAMDLGLPRPEVTVISGRMLGESDVNEEGQRAIAGLETETCIVIERGIGFRAAVERLRALDFRFQHVIRLTHGDRRRIVRIEAGADLAAGGGEAKISTGLFTAALALHLGAVPAVLAGFSLSRDGHAYSASGFVRHHKDMDRMAFEHLKERHPALSTADPALHADAGITLLS